MKEILSSAITGGIKQPFLKDTWLHLQEAYTDLFRDMFLNTMQDFDKNLAESGTPYALSESPLTLDGGLTYEVFEGFYFYSGEFYKVDAVASLAMTPPNIPVLALAPNEFIAGDPVTMSDGSTENVHLIKKMEWAAGLTGSGLVDFDDIRFYKNAYKLGNLETGNINTGADSWIIALGGVEAGAGKIKQASKTIAGIDLTAGNRTAILSSMDQDDVHNIAGFTILCRDTSDDGPWYNVSHMCYIQFVSQVDFWIVPAAPVDTFTASTLKIIVDIRA